MDTQEIPRVLVVDDDPFIIELLRDFLSAAGFNLTLSDDPISALDQAKRERFDVVLLDIMMPRLDGLSFLEMIKVVPNSPEVVMITARSDADLVARAMKMGAFDYIVKPISIQRLIMATKNAMARRALSDLNAKGGLAPAPGDSGHEIDGYFAGGKVGSDLVTRARQLAHYFAFMLVKGPEGSGKASWIQLCHRLSDRADRPLVIVDCPSVPRQKISRELFGYMEGTPPRETYLPGALKRADGGILWLKNLESLPDFVQAKLTEYMDSGNLLVPGLPEDEYLDVKIVASTSLDIDSEIERKRFNANFLRRLSLITVEIPPLDQRRDEIIEMAEFFVKQYATTARKPACALDRDLHELFRVFPWAKNVTHLREAVRQAVEQSTGPIIELKDLPHSLRDYNRNLSYILARDAASQLD